ncbi:cytochrome P450 [Amycolatopsis jiangsuensis]|uniref:Cytochrome P450 n=1 Tax=Amycolatopsis jiangsuensis TaxID=1181879 RepID=A0A840ILR1_9PSEU|nr:cytochrome P450 [Amycolatopsis jiangsuensis]MBB4682873.1 cytochrome P450 [Amycolatopsis jiangsuensis]
MTTSRLPAGPSAPWFVQAVYALTRPRRGLGRIRDRYGDAFTVKSPVFGRVLVLGDPAEIKQLFQLGPNLAENVEPNLGRVLGPGSLFALTGDEHRKQRKLLVPPFHGRRLAAYERIMQEETDREFASWPQGREFATLPSMMRITLNIILRAVFGADGPEFDRLRELLPALVELGSKLAVLPIPTVDWGRWSPWGRFRIMRREYNGIIEHLIAKAEREGDLDAREDILALMLQARYDDGTPMSHRDIADQLLTILSAGHETTATTLAWAVERLRRHPDVLSALSEEDREGGKALREATIVEVQRTRPVIDVVGRKIHADGVPLGRWTLPKGLTVLVGISLVHENPDVFPDPARFDPQRFVTAKPDLYEWIPFGGGARRCLGAAFANLEMHVVLRTLLRDFDLAATTAPGEAWHSRGIANAPGKGGLAVVRRRRTDPAAPAPASTAGAR